MKIYLVFLLRINMTLLEEDLIKKIKYCLKL